MEGNSIITNMNPMVAYQKGLRTWARWVDLNLNPRKTRVIFRSMSPRHNRYSLFLLPNCNKLSEFDYDYLLLLVVIYFIIIRKYILSLIWSIFSGCNFFLICVS